MLRETIGKSQWTPDTRHSVSTQPPTSGAAGCRQSGPHAPFAGMNRPAGPDPPLPVANASPRSALQRLRPVDHCRRVHAVGHIANIGMHDRVPCRPAGPEGTVQPFTRCRMPTYAAGRSKSACGDPWASRIPAMSGSVRAAAGPRYLALFAVMPYRCSSIVIP